jgi:hypothetical protein
MNTRKNLLIVVGEWWEARRTESSVGAPGGKPSRLSRLARWLMPNGGTLLLIALLIATQGVWARNLQSPAAPGPSATTVNYQGRLADSGGTPINGTRGMEFAIFDAATGGNLIWGPETHAAIPVSNGLFSVGLGSQTSGGIPTTAWNGDRYLEIRVGGETLSPRELIRSVPIAGMALTVPDGAINLSRTNFLAGSAKITGALTSCDDWFGSGEVHCYKDLTVSHNFGNANYLVLTGTNHGMGAHRYTVSVFDRNPNYFQIRTSSIKAGGYWREQDEIEVHWLLVPLP